MWLLLCLATTFGYNEIEDWKGFIPTNRRVSVTRRKGEKFYAHIQCSWRKHRSHRGHQKLRGEAAHVNLKVYSDKTAKVEVTIPLSFLTLRAEETSPDLYASIDLVTDKLERQVRKFKTKINRKSREKGFGQIDIDATAPAEPKPAEDDDNLTVVRTKRVSLKPMDSQEAILQMDMLGHNFFIFEDADTNGTSIVYKRRDGRYGLIETDE